MILIILIVLLAGLALILANSAGWRWARDCVLHTYGQVYFAQSKWLGLGLLLYTMGARVVPAVELTLLSLAEVVLGPVWVWLFLGEAPTPTTLAGVAILLGAITFNAVSGARRRPPVTLA